MTRFRTLAVLTLGVALALGPADAHAATRTWTGAVSGLWSVAGNWLENTVPVAGDDLVFGGLPPHSATVNDLAAGIEINSLSFTSEAFSLAGNAITLGAGGIIQNSSTTVSSNITLPIILTAPARPVTMSGNGLGILILGGVVSGSGGLAVSNTATSNRSLYLTQANTFSGGISVTGLQVNVGHNAAFGTGTVTNIDSTIVTGGFSVANALHVQGCGPGSTSAAVDHYGTWSGAVIVTGNVCLGMYGTDPPLVFSGPVSGAHRITAARGGVASVVTFSGDSPAFTGEIATVGTVRIDANFSSASADLKATGPGATLAGTGRIGVVEVTSGAARLAPGTSPGLFRTGPLTLGTGAFLDIELTGTTPGSGYDQLNVTGTTTLNDVTLNASLGFVPPPGASFVIIDNDGVDPVVGTFAGLPEGAALNVTGVMFHVSYVGGTGNDVVLTVAQPVPTLPAVLFLLLAVVLLAAGRRTLRNGPRPADVVS